VAELIPSTVKFWRSRLVIINYHL